jgi:hypothetical protein
MKNRPITCSARAHTRARSARTRLGIGLAVLSVATMATAVAPEPVAADTTGPVIVHTPATTSLYGQPVPITFATTCPTGAACSARIYYRTTVPEALAAVPGVVNPGGFSVAPVSGSATTVDSQQAILWTGEIPASATTTTGVDYFLEADQNGTRTVHPGTATVDTVQPVGTFFHVTTVSPPLLNHVPVPVAVADQPMGVEAQVSCSSGNCSATLWYRKTPKTAATDGGWAPTSMAPQTPTVPLGGAATLIRYRGEVPASSVDTMGVDYWIHVFDGHAQAYHPGTPYQGYYVPRDGTRPPLTHHHVHVLEAPRIVHEPLPAGLYRQNNPVVAQATCPSTRQCQATLYYRTTPPGIAPGVLANEGFSSNSMSITRAGAAGIDGIVVQGAIPAGVSDTRGVDYFFSISDGTTTSWWPGTSAADGPGVWVDGIRVAYHHVRVLEPPHFAHVPVVTAPALQDLVIETQLSCVTESCTATLHYNTSALDISGSYQSVSMTKVSQLPPTTASRVEVWRYVIPAGQVTTRGLAYYMTASDGYTNTAAPGTFYWGAYAPVDGSNPAPAAALFVVRVVDPPHPVHAPPGVAFTGEPLVIDAVSNCATNASCTATLHWRVLNGTWQANGMNVVSSTTLAYGNSLKAYRYTIPGLSVVEPALEYRIEITDGYVTESSPPYAVAVTERPDPGSQGTVAAFAPPVGVGALESDVPLVVLARRPDGTAFSGTIHWCAQPVASTTCTASGTVDTSNGSAGFTVRPTAASPTLRVTAYADGLNVGTQDPTEVPGVAVVVGVDPPSPPQVTTVAFTPPAAQTTVNNSVELTFRAVRRDGPAFTGTVRWSAGAPGTLPSYTGEASADADGTGRFWVTPTDSTSRLQVLAYADSSSGGVFGAQDPTEVSGSAVVVATPPVTPPPGTAMAFAPPVGQGPTGSTVSMPFKATNADGTAYSGPVRYSVRQANELPVFDGSTGANGGEGSISVPITAGRAYQVLAYADFDGSGTAGATEVLAAAAVVNSTPPPPPTPGTELVFTDPVATAPPGVAVTVFFRAFNYDGSPFSGTVWWGYTTTGGQAFDRQASAQDGQGFIQVNAAATPVQLAAYADRASSGVPGQKDESEVPGAQAVVGVP